MSISQSTLDSASAPNRAAEQDTGSDQVGALTRGVFRQRAQPSQRASPEKQPCHAAEVEHEKDHLLAGCA